MKPAPFEYEAPRTLGEALATLSERGDEATLLAGGQSLVPLLNFRLARPALVVDLNGVGELAYLRRDGEGLRIGAMARSAELERSEEVALGWPLLREAVGYVGHPPIRNRGTVGGSVAHADPAAELPVALLALDARFRLRSARGVRDVSAGEFFVSAFTTAREADEALVEIEVPPLPPRTGAAFVEHARVRGDFALSGAGALVTLDEDARCSRAVVALLACGLTPVRAEAAERSLLGRQVDEEAAREAALRAVEGIELSGSIRADPDFRRALTRELVRRAVLRAAERVR